MAKKVMMKYIVLIYSMVVGLVISSSAQVNPYYHENAVFREEIKSVQLYREGFELSSPVLELGSGDRLILTFDELSDEVRNYYYSVLHCDPEWNESNLMQTDYIDGFAENPIEDYARSFNTTFSYVNYLLAIPNEQMDIKMSGNYILLVYEDRDMEKLVLSKRFYVTEKAATIEGTVRRATLDAFKGSNHEVDFTVFHPGVKIENPLSEVKVVVMQNGRWDNAIRDLRPLFIQDGRLTYDYSQENVFPAGNEFRYFDIRNKRINGEGVLETSFHRPYYHVTLMPDEIRSNKRFFPYREMNGRYVVESQEPVQDYHTECDYQFVHFSLPLEAPLMGGTINVFGELSNWNANKSNEMTWNFETGRYELTLLLKQGYYNYMYVYVPEGAASADHVNLEGSFWETENDYQIMVYYRPMSSRYYRLIGYRHLNSKLN